jgi:hypothetical protein
MAAQNEITSRQGNRMNNNVMQTGKSGHVRSVIPACFWRRVWQKCSVFAFSEVIKPRCAGR